MIDQWPYGIGLGTAELDKQQPEKMAELLEQAILRGYRFLDTAYSYGTEEIVGRALKAAFNRGIPREALFIQTKFYPVMPYDGDSVEPQLRESLEKLGVDYVDGYLIHQPVPRYSELDYAGRNRSVWKKMEQLRRAGTVRHIGVSNFLERHILQLPGEPEINQLEINPQFQQRGLADFCRERGMQVQGWGSLSVTEEPVKAVLSRVGQSHGVSAAQAALKWNLQMGNVPICSSRNLSHLTQNRELDFQLTEEELETIRQCNSADAHRKTWWYPRQQMY